MAINDIVQTVAEARVDARSLSEFVFKPADFTVTRRLAPSVRTLQFYIDRFNSLNGVFSSSVSVALSSLNNSVAEAQGKVAYIESTVQDAINNTAVEGGVLADTFVTATANGVGTVARTQRDVNSDIINVKDFGAKGDGVTDDTVAFEAMTAYAKTLTDGASILIPMGEYKVTRHIMFELPSHSVLDCHGVIASTLLSDVLVTVGSAEVAKFYYDIRGLDVKYKGTNTVWSNINQDTNGTSVAVRLLNVCLSTVHIRQARFCYTGLWLDGSLPSGSLAYNDIYINNLKDNVVCLLLKPSTNNGYVNENTIYGGAYGHSGSFPFTGNEVDIKFEPFGGLSLNVNNNLIFRPSLESNSLASIAASIAGKFNQIYMPRMENPKNPAFPIIFETNSEICSLTGGGWSLTVTNVTDLGRGNSYETQSGNVLRNSGRSEDISAFTYQNISSDAQKTLGVVNNSGILTFWVNGVGDVYSRGSGYFRTGMRWFSQDGTNNDRGLFVASGDAASTSADKGSLHVSTSTGKISMKESGKDGTGWRTLQAIVARATAPTGYEVGQHYFNTTLGKPVWWNGTAWVDSAGAAV